MFVHTFELVNIVILCLDLNNNSESIVYKLFNRHIEAISNERNKSNK